MSCLSRASGLSIVLLFALGASQDPSTPSVSCSDATAPLRIGQARMMTSRGALVFSTPRLAVDADGAPSSYRVDGNGLSFTCDGVVAVENGRRITPKSDPTNWQRKCREAWATARRTQDYRGVSIFGFLTDRGRPVVQGSGDPLPGLAYVTTTSVPVPGSPGTTQRHWVDASEIPYVVLPSSVVSSYHVAPGAVAVLWRPRTDKLAYAIYGDVGDLGEASIQAHRSLGSDPMVVTGGVRRAKAGIGDPVVTILFPSEAAELTRDPASLRRSLEGKAQTAFSSWGGIERLKACSAKLH